EPTLSLMAVTLLFAVLVAVPAGVVAAWQASRAMVDRSVRGVALLGFSVAIFMLGIGQPFLASTVAVVAALGVGMGTDRIIMAFAVMGFSVPVFVIGYVLAYVFALQLDWLPVQGYAPLADGFTEWITRLILPALALGCVYIALIARTTRAAMLEVLQQDY